MYPYLTFADETLVTHSDLQNEDGVDRVVVHFERPREGGFDSARCVLPDYAWSFCDGFSEEEQMFFDEFLTHNAHLLYRYAAAGGIHCA